MCLIEAAASGMPLISYDCAPGIRDIIIDGYNGYIIAQDDKEAFIENYHALLMNQHYRLRWERIVEKLLILSLVNRALNCVGMKYWKAWKRIFEN